MGARTRTFKKGFRGVWSDFGLSPNACMNKVSEGKLRIAGKDEFFGRNIYEVVEEFVVDQDTQR